MNLKLVIKILLFIFFCIHSLFINAQSLCTDLIPCIINDLEVDIEVYHKINNQAIEPALYEVFNSNKETSFLSRQSYSRYRLRDLIRINPADTHKPILKSLKIIFVMNEIPISREGVIGLKLALGERSITNGRIPSIPHHFEFYKNKKTNKFEAVIHFAIDGWIMDKRKFFPANILQIEDKAKRELEQTSYLLSRIKESFTDIDPTIKHPPGGG